MGVMRTVTVNVGDLTSDGPGTLVDCSGYDLSDAVLLFSGGGGGTINVQVSNDEDSSLVTIFEPETNQWNSVVRGAYRWPLPHIGNIKIAISGLTSGTAKLRLLGARKKLAS